MAEYEPPPRGWRAVAVTVNCMEWQFQVFFSKSLRNVFSPKLGYQILTLYCTTAK